MTTGASSISILDVIGFAHEFLPHELVEEFRDACVEKVSHFADDYFSELFFIVCSGITIILSPRHTFIGAIIGHYTRPYLPSYPFERNRVVTVLNASLSGVGVITAFVSCFLTSNTISVVSLVSGIVIENTTARFCRKYLLC